MFVNALLDINNIPEIDGQGYEVVTNVEGTLWHYGFFTEIERAQTAIQENPEYRFMVTIEG